MDLKEAIRLEHSKKNCRRITHWIGDRQDRFDQLIQIVAGSDCKDSQRASWPLSEAAIAHPALVRKHLKTLVRNLERPGQHEAVKRNTVRILQYINIPLTLQGKVMDLCFNYLISPTEKPAVKANALTVIYNLSQKHPVIRNELLAIIDQQWDQESKAFRSRASAILKSLSAHNLNR
jgi:hypothetical protein